MIGEAAAVMCIVGASRKPNASKDVRMVMARCSVLVDVSMTVSVLGGFACLFRTPDMSLRELPAVNQRVQEQARVPSRSSMRSGSDRRLLSEHDQAGEALWMRFAAGRAHEADSGTKTVDV